MGILAKLKFLKKIESGEKELIDARLNIYFEKEKLKMDTALLEFQKDQLERYNQIRVETMNQAIKLRTEISELKAQRGFESEFTEQKDNEIHQLKQMINKLLDTITKKQT